MRIFKSVGVLALIVALISVGSIPVQAQSIQNTSIDHPFSCAVLSSGGTSNNTTYNNTGSYDSTISIGGGTIKYPGNTNYQPISTDPGITTITATPTTILTKPTNNFTNVLSFAPSNSSETTDAMTAYTTSPSTCGISMIPADTETHTPTPIENTANVDTPLATPDPISAELTVNDTGIAYVQYGGSATLKWKSTGTSSCSLDAIGQSGTGGQYTLRDITNNTVITLECDAAPGYANYQLSPSWLGRVEVKVLPPTFEYLKSSIHNLQSTSGKKIKLASVSNYIDRSQKAYKAGKTDKAKALLKKSVYKLKQQPKRSISADDIARYESAVHYLNKTLSVKVVIAADGCSVTATGSAGLILQYGANEHMRRGYGEEAIIPASGSITATIYAPNGWQSTAEVVDTTGLIYARDTKNVTIDSCPQPPSEPVTIENGGYPSLWADAPIDTIVDNWGFYNRQSTSYAAFKVSQSGRVMPYGFGTAKQWPANAMSRGIPVDTTPQAGSVAININGFYGHAMYVEAVLSDGSMRVSEYDGSGSYGERTITPDPASYRFVHFPTVD